VSEQIQVRGHPDDDERQAVLAALEQVRQAGAERSRYQRWRDQRLAAISGRANPGR
jgi:hypothetical protein